MKQKKSSGDTPKDSAINKKLFAGAIIAFLAVMISTVWYAITKQGDSFDNHLLLTGFLVGIVAQTVDGALGMAYGVTSSSFYLPRGRRRLLPPRRCILRNFYHGGGGTQPLVFSQY